MSKKKIEKSEAAPAVEVAAETAPVTIQSIKGFNKDMTCRDFQFAQGQTYTHEGHALCCSSGFHACPTDVHPLSVFSYYPPAGSRYFLVEQGGDICRDEDDKAASTLLTINIEIGIGDLVKRAWDWVWDKAIKSDEAHVTIERGAASSTGNQGAASSTGDYGAASSTGNQGAASSTGYRGAASSTGDYGAASSTGDYGAASSTGNQGAASSTGNQGAAMASGYAGRVMGADGNALFAVERDDEYKILSVACGIVGQGEIKPSVWYVCQGGTLVEWVA